MKTLITTVILLTTVIVLTAGACVSCTPEMIEAREEYFRTVKTCVECGGSGRVLDWDSIKTGLLKDTPEDERVYNECSFCEGLGWVDVETD